MPGAFLAQKINQVQESALENGHQYCKTDNQNVPENKLDDDFDVGVLHTLSVLSGAKILSTSFLLVPIITFRFQVLNITPASSDFLNFWRHF